jgi:hypothetical protein
MGLRFKSSPPLQTRPGGQVVWTLNDDEIILTPSCANCQENYRLLKQSKGSETSALSTVLILLKSDLDCQLAFLLTVGIYL